MSQATKEYMGSEFQTEQKYKTTDVSSGFLSCSRFLVPFAELRQPQGHVVSKTPHNLYISPQV